MEIKIRAKGLDLDSRLKNHIEKKIGGLRKFFDDITLIRVDLSSDVHHRRGNVFYAEVIIELKSRNLFVKENAGDFYTALSLCRESLMAEIRKFKTKIRDKKRREERFWKRWIKIWRRE